MRHAVRLAVHAVGFVAIETGDAVAWADVAVAVLGIARVDIALTAVAVAEIQNLRRRQLPGDHAVDIFIAHPFAPGGVRAVLRVVDIPGVSVGFIDIAIQAHGERIARQRAAETEVSAFGRPFFVIFRLVGKQRQAAVPVVGWPFGDDVNHSARRAGAVTCRSRAAQYLNALDHFWRHPVAVAARITFAAPAVAHRVA